MYHVGTLIQQDSWDPNLFIWHFSMPEAVLYSGDAEMDDRLFPQGFYRGMSGIDNCNGVVGSEKC